MKWLKPKAAHEIEIRKGSYSMAGMLTIYTISYEAQQFIRSKAPEFGKLVEDCNPGKNQKFWLDVFENYNINEVKKYLEHFNQ